MTPPTSGWRSNSRSSAVTELPTRSIIRGPRLMPAAPCVGPAGRRPSAAPAIQRAWYAETCRLYPPPGARSRARAPVPKDRAPDSPGDRKYTTPAAAPAPPPPPTPRPPRYAGGRAARVRSEEHTSELQSQSNLVCRLLLEKKKKKTQKREDNNKKVLVKNK